MLIGRCIRLRNERHQRSKSTGLGMDRNITINSGRARSPPICSSCAVHEGSNTSGTWPSLGSMVCQSTQSSSAQYHWERCTGAPLRVRNSVGFARRGPGTSDIRSPSARTVSGTKDK
ncbi:hypothetical protein IG631_16606 [Alternaria alternata]|nr:hypothetical protein IG631_16606 [Alternaria alternata]